jgi:retinol dehydrogenase 12
MYEGSAWRRLHLYIIYPFFWYLTKSPQQGSQTTLYLVLEEFEKLVPGGYYSDCKLAKNSAEADNPETSQKLW